MGTRNDILINWGPNDDLFDKFMELHPNSTEEFNPTPENIARWKYHVDIHEGRQAFQNQFAPYRTESAAWALRLAESRRIEKFSDFPTETQRRYQKLADKFPGVQLYACGSRVKGDWIDQDSAPVFGMMRKALGKSDKISDFDFVIPSYTTEERYEAMRMLPHGYDLLIFGVPDDEMIPIPMWDFDKLPEHEHQNAIDYYNAQRWGALMQMHNLYQLSPAHYCCDESPTIKWFKWAIETGKLKTDEQRQISEQKTV